MRPFSRTGVLVCPCKRQTASPSCPKNRIGCAILSSNAQSIGSSGGMIGKTRQSAKNVKEVFDPGIGPARGLLRWPPPEGQFRHERRHAPVDLSPWINSYWMVMWDLDRPYCQESLPHPTVHLVFESGECAIQGPITEKFSRPLEGKGAVFGLAFKSGGFRPFLGAPVATLQNCRVPAAAVFGRAIAIHEATLASLAWEADRMIE